MYVGKSQVHGIYMLKELFLSLAIHKAGHRFEFCLKKIFYAPEGLGAVFSLTDISCVWCELHCL